MIKPEDFKDIFDECSLQGEKIVITSDLHRTLDFVKTRYSFDTLKDILAVDKRDKGIELTYHLYSYRDDEDLWISIYVKNEAESIVDLYKSAIADENEIYDMFGIKFIGNESLKRLYMPENWDGHPLKKDYAEKDSRLVWNDDNNS